MPCCACRGALTGAPGRACLLMLCKGAGRDAAVTDADEVSRRPLGSTAKVVWGRDRSRSEPERRGRRGVDRTIRSRRVGSLVTASRSARSGC
eukprot:1494806-Rhodomonas_salina.1